MASELMLDPAIRDWVLIPIVIVMYLMGILRNNVSKVLRKDVPPDTALIKNNNLLNRARRLRANAMFIPKNSFLSRRAFLCEEPILDPKGKKVKGTGGPLKQEQDKPDPMKMMQDPNVMMNMMQGNMAMMVPQMAMMGIINYFFSGFVLGKIPFALTPSFKGMLQRGISLTTLDTSYVTSMSWYFLVMFGMRGLYSITTPGGAVDDTQMMQAQMGMGAQQQGPGQAPDMGKLFEAEAENMQIVDHTWSLDAAEERLLKSAGGAKSAARKKKDD